MNLQKMAPIGKEGDAAYFWKSEHEVLWLRHATQHDKAPVLVRHPEKPFHKSPAPGHYEAVVLDTHTQTWHTLKPFNARSAPLLSAQIMYVSCEGEADSEVHHTPPSCALSTDGQWLVWHTRNLGGKPGWVAATLDGEQQLTWPTEIRKNGWPVGQAAWKNSREWVETIQTYTRAQYSFPGACVRRTDDVQFLQSVRFSQVNDALLLGATAEERLLWYDPPPQTLVASVHMREVGLHPALAFTWNYEVALPEESQVSSVALSTQGTRLAWLLGGLRQTANVYTLWISDRRGKQFECLGQLPGITYPAADLHTQQRYDWPRDLKWLPSGSQVSFLYEGSLCAVAIV